VREWQNGVRRLRSEGVRELREGLEFLNL